jgi:hypothetical protein
VAPVKAGRWQVQLLSPTPRHPYRESKALALTWLRLDGFTVNRSVRIPPQLRNAGSTVDLFDDLAQPGTAAHVVKSGS